MFEEIITSNEVKIMVPKSLSDKEKKLFIDLSKISNYKPRKIYG